MYYFSEERKRSKYYPYYEELLSYLREDPERRTIKEFCEERGIGIKEFGEWLRDNNIFARELKERLIAEKNHLEDNHGAEDGTFLRLSVPENGDFDNPEIYHGVEIVFVNGVSVKIGRCRLNQLVDILYGYRPNRRR